MKKVCSPARRRPVAVEHESQSPNPEPAPEPPDTSDMVAGIDERPPRRREAQLATVPPALVQA
jgi:hypothetical protein